MSEKEVDSLRDSAFVPADRIQAYEKILDAREQWIDDLLKDRRHVSFADDVHDAMDQFGQIADELNDNLDEYNDHHRDVRKILPRLVAATERWSTSLRAPAEDDRYEVVRKIALNAVKDMRELAEQMATEQAAYFKEHPDAAKQEKQRSEDPHAPDAGAAPK